MTVRKTRKMRALEERYRKPIEQLLRDLYVGLGSLQAVAVALGVDVRTVWMWMYKFDIPRRQWSLPPELTEQTEIKAS